MNSKVDNIINIGLVHIGKREKSGLQILEKLKQHNYSVKQWDVLDGADNLNQLDEVDVIVVNIGMVTFEYDDLLTKLFDKDIKIIINEATLSNKLSGMKRVSWERHLLNKIDPSFSILPNSREKSIEKDKMVDLNNCGVSSVWILAASIGGPEAIQKFLAEFNGTESVLFIIIQHMDKEFLPMMTQQFNKNCQFNVEIPVSGIKILPSSCLIHPTDENIKIYQNGLLELEVINDVYGYTPCIDECTKYLLGHIKNLNMAIFSGMSKDGVAAAKMIKDKGNRVITQSESSCVLSTIIEGVKKTITVDFDGAPQEMAQYIINTNDSSFKNYVNVNEEIKNGK